MHAEAARVVVNEPLDWPGVPIILHRGKTHRVTYDSLRIHAERHYDFAATAA